LLPPEISFGFQFIHSKRGENAEETSISENMKKLCNLMQPHATALVFSVQVGKKDGRVKGAGAQRFANAKVEHLGETHLSGRKSPRD
jgi:hypothetical protein